MNQKITNGYLQPYINDIKILSKNNTNYLDNMLASFQINLNKNENLNNILSWKDTENAHSFFYNYENNEVEIRDYLMMTPISKEIYLIVELGYDEPIIRVKTDIFINHWDDFLAASGYIGVLVIGESGKYFMEFTDRDFMLYSNFKIKDNY